MKAGAVDLLTKPVDDHALIAAIQRAVTRDKHDRAVEGRRAAIQRRVRLLTPREIEVFALVVTGMLNRQIAAALGIAEKTVKVHRGRVMKKMRAGSVAELVPTGRRGRRDRTQDLIRHAGGETHRRRRHLLQDGGPEPVAICYQVATRTPRTRTIQEDIPLVRIALV